MTNRRIVTANVYGVLFDAHEDSNYNRKKRRQNLLRFDYYPETDSLYIELIRPANVPSTVTAHKSS